MSDQLELDRKREDLELDLDAPAKTSPNALLSSKPGELTGALVQRGRERAPRLMETSMPMEFEQPDAALAAMPLLETAAEPSAPLATPRSRWTNVVFAAACCIAFFAAFLFVLRF
jgi:hypothetical protein